MPNLANQPFADALARVYPAPEGAKIFTASAEAKKMLAFWSVKQSTLSQVLRVGNDLFRVVLHKCPHCEEHLSAQAVKMSQKEREMLVALASMLKTPDASKPASVPAKKQAKQASKPAPVPVPVEPNTADEVSLEELEALTSERWLWRPVEERDGRQARKGATVGGKPLNGDVAKAR